jgi:hypothetical protein
MASLRKTSDPICERDAISSGCRFHGGGATVSLKRYQAV